MSAQFAPLSSHKSAAIVWYIPDSLFFAQSQSHIRTSFTTNQMPLPRPSSSPLWRNPNSISSLPCYWISEGFIFFILKFAVNSNKANLTQLRANGEGADLCISIYIYIVNFVQSIRHVWVYLHVNRVQTLYMCNRAFTQRMQASGIPQHICGELHVELKWNICIDTLRI